MTVGESIASPAATELPGWSRLVVPVVVGLLAGLVLAGRAADERLSVRVAPELVVLTRGDQPGRRIDRAAIAAVFVDGADLVLLDHSSAELARERHELPVPQLRAAFQGYPWRDGRPDRP